MINNMKRLNSVVQIFFVYGYIWMLFEYFTDNVSFCISHRSCHMQTTRTDMAMNCTTMGVFHFKACYLM